VKNFRDETAATKSHRRLDREVNFGRGDCEEIIMNEPNKAEYFKVGDLPRSFMDETGRMLGDFSIALGYMRNGRTDGFHAIGSGVLVTRAGRFGILTALHCLHSPGLDVRLGPSGCDRLFLVLRNGRGLVVQPQDVVEHQLVTPQSQEFGPDLAFIEVLPGERLASLKAVGSFWSLDKNPAEIMEHFGTIGTPVASIGYPGLYYDTRISGDSLQHKIHHMTYYFAIGKDAIIERDGWDYIENTCYYGPSHELPATFEGVSGGPVWGMHIRKDKADGHLTVLRSALIGISFYQTAIENDERRLRAHFIKSIYDLAWRNLG